MIQRKVVPLIVLALMAAGLASPVRGQSSSDGGGLLRPEQHFRIDNPARLTPGEASTIYDDIAGDMARGYAISRDPVARNYLKWRRFNSAPYKSVTHGNRYLNNYANPKAAELYGRLEPGREMPPGSIVAKDSFTVTDGGAVFAGALFIMEKLAPGSSPASGDWRYAMILPDGSFLGDSTAENADKMVFCNACHQKVAKSDYLYLIPKAFRRY